MRRLKLDFSLFP
uniref:Uncharacterized protein n=1 Tax=Arundo donax TaxID=35708 RepID=A0A0A9ABR7_ARUDO